MFGTTNSARTTISEPTEAVTGERAARLAAIHAETTRQLADLSVRQANTITRASIAATAGGAITAIQTSTLPTPWFWISIVLALAATGLALATIWQWSTHAADILRLPQEALLDYQATDLLLRFDQDARLELGLARRDYTIRVRLVKAAVAGLAASLLTTAVLGILLNVGAI